MSDAGVPASPVPSAAAPLPNGAVPPAASVAPPAATPDPQVAARLAAIGRKEAEAVRKIREASTMEQRIKAQEQAIAAREAKVAEFEKLWQDNPLKAIEARGSDYTKLTQMMLNDNKPTPEHYIQQLSTELKELKAQLAERDTKAQESQKTQAQQQAADAEKQYKAQLETNLKANSEKYPLTALYSRADLVYSTMDAHYKATAPKDDEGRVTGPGEILDEGKAFQLVEDYLQAEASKALPVLQRKTGTAPPPATQETRPGSRYQEPQQFWHERQPKTLTNDMPSGVPSAPKRMLSEEDRMANALAKLRAGRGR